MSESIISNQVNKILNRFDQKLSSSPSYAKTLELLKISSINESKISEVRPNTQTDPVKTLTCLQEIYQNSIGKYLHPRLQSKTPDLPDPQPSKLRSTTPAPPAPPATTSTEVTQTTQLPQASPASLAPSTLSKSPSQKIPSTQRFHPKLNKNSLKIASRLCSSQERLTPNVNININPNPNSNLLTTPTSKHQSQEDEFTYQPQINLKSKKLSSKNPESNSRWDHLYLQGQCKQKELAKLRELSIAKENSYINCSFKPNTLNPSQETNPSATVQRLEIWAKNKETKIKQQKETNAINTFKECTFMPKITENFPTHENFQSIKGVTRYINQGKKVQTLLHNSSTSRPSPCKSLNKHKFNQLVAALRSELFTIQL